jgi:hypothetical protein
MLTGLPPFYDQDTNEKHHKILTKPLNFPGPNIVPPTAKDLLTKLLNRKPEQILGANGASEIKCHPFFHGIDWHKLLQRKYEPTFKPTDVAEIFREEPRSASSTWKKTSKGLLYARGKGSSENKSGNNTSAKESDLVNGHDEFNALPGKDGAEEGSILPDETTQLLLSLSPQVGIAKDDGWMLIWEDTVQAFLFFNRFTNATQPATLQAPGPVTPGIEAKPALTTPIPRATAPHDASPTMQTPPNQTQLRDALEVALQAT